MRIATQFLNQTKNGRFTFCDRSKLFQITFNNLYFEFYEWELENFKSYITLLINSQWESPDEVIFNSKKIPISVGNNCFIILLSREELFELHHLLHITSKYVPILKAKDIDYRFIEN